MRYTTNVKKIRDAYGISQLEFANKLGVGQTSVSHWERGVNKPSALIEEKIAKLADKKGLKFRVGA